MAFRTDTHPSLTLAALLLLATATGCQGLSSARPMGGAGPETSHAFFAAALDHFARDSMNPFPILVDPRPLRPEAELHSVTEDDLIPDARTTAMRTRVVESAGWHITRAPTDWRCVFSQTLPPAQPGIQDSADSLQLIRASCRQRGQYQSVVFGLPQSSTDPDHPERWRIRSMRMLLNGYEVMDLFLAPGPDGEWTVVETRVRSGVFS